MPNSNSAVVRPSSARRRGFIGWVKGMVAADRRPAAAARRVAAAAGATVEALEDRQLMSVVYVSASAGNDRNNGSSPGAAVRSFARAARLTDPGDQMLLRAGDTWNTAIGMWSKNNTVIGSYGSGARPRVVTSADGINIYRSSNVTIRNISLVGANRTTRAGITMAGTNNNILIENVEVRGFRMNIVAHGFFAPINNLRIRNSQITDSNANGLSSGLYADRVYGLTLEGNTFDRNGGRGSLMNHGAYITALCRNFVARNNTFANSSNFGLQARGGGEITGNTFRNNAIGLSVGLVNGAGVHTDGGVTCNVTNNTFTGVGVGLTTNGLGILVGNIRSGTIANNRFTNGTRHRWSAAIMLDRGNAAGRQVGVNNLRITGNTASNWGGHGIDITRAAGARNVITVNNRL